MPRVSAIVLLLLSSLGCSSEESNPYPYALDEIRVIGGDGGEYEADANDECGAGASADVIVDEDGDVLSIVCYPNEGYEVVTLEDEAQEPELGDHVVAVLDGDDDGVDVKGDLLIDGQNVIVYGAGPEASVIEGNLEVIEDGAIARGVRIEGDAILRKDGAALVDCAIEGDLIVIGDGVTIARCEVWGDVIMDGSHAVLVSTLVAGDQQLSGDDLRCNDNHRFTDIEGDGVVQDDDVLAPIACTSE